MTTPASAEPTAEQRAAGVATVEQTCQYPPSMFEPTEWEWVDAIARALAAAVTAEREKVRDVALQLECHAEAHQSRSDDARTLGHMSTAGMERVRAETMLDAARCIREVTT